MTILSFFTLNIPIRRLWTNLYHKEDHFLKIWPLLHYFSEIYLKICDFALFKKFFCPLNKKHALKDFFSKYDQIRRKPRIWSHLLKLNPYWKHSYFCVVIFKSGNNDNHQKVKHFYQGMSVFFSLLYIQPLYFPQTIRDDLFDGLWKMKAE